MKRFTLEESIGKLEKEHESASEILKAIRRETGNFTVPQDGCTTYRLAYRKLMELERNTIEHVHLENNILLRNMGR